MLSLPLTLACETDEPVALDRASAEKFTSEGADATVDTPPPRIVAVGDVHGDPAALLHVLSLAGLVDASGAWSGGAATLVQTGDITDRGPDSKGVIATLRRLQAEAAAAEGQVVPLLGNHEVMNMQGDLRYVNAEDTLGYGGEAARAAAFSPAGDDGKWLRGNDAVAMIDGTVFCHGGVTPRWAAAGVLRLNQMVRAAIDTPAPGPGEPRIGLADVLGPDGPLWYRGYLLEEEPVACKELDHALQVLGGERLVVGHTTQESGEVAVRCGGKLYGIDTGVSAHYGNHYAALEIRGDAVHILSPASATAPLQPPSALRPPTTPAESR
ncbi:MAG: metallophosphoesterase [Deltaproteobacteria bacterium]|nr:metallophosphoesterase [Deltaproteobacteria bacterium]